MLTDVFSIRYEETPVWSSYGERERRCMSQILRIIIEQVFPLTNSTGYDGNSIIALRECHDKLCMELGKNYLHPSIKNGDRIEDILISFFNAAPEKKEIDRFIKERISFVELAFRAKDEKLSSESETLPYRLIEARKHEQTMGEASRNSILYTLTKMGGWASEAETRAQHSEMKVRISADIAELNERLHRAGLGINYNSGFIQFSDDEFVEANISKPFWTLMGNNKWVNARHDMQEAIDRRDNGRKEAALSAAKALESVIKIISDEKGRTIGNEKGAASFIDNLVRDVNGRFIDVWEGDVLRSFFKEVRNKLGHGPGNQPMPQLSKEQESWAIETCMSWIKTLITRM